MSTVFSHIVQKRFSQSYEDIATDSLAYIFDTHDSARLGFMSFLRKLIPDMPDLHFRTQVGERGIRPDMWGYNGMEPHIFVENKFWAGLTENQPVAYLHELATHSHPTLLLMIVPGAREQTMVIELIRRLREAEIDYQPVEIRHKGFVWGVKTGGGPWLALTSWPRVIDILAAAAEDIDAKNDLALLLSLCEAADIDRFMPLNPEALTDQMTPTLILQLGQIIRETCELGVRESLMNKDGLHEISNWEKFGRYIWLGGGNGVGLWLGVDFELWKTHGISPLWLRFSTTNYGRSYEVKPFLDSWEQDRHYLLQLEDGSLALSMEILSGANKDQVVRHLLDQFRNLARVLKALPPAKK